MFGFGSLASVGGAAAGGSVLVPAMATLSAGEGLINAGINYKNYQLQRDQYDYSKYLQQIMFNREDTAIQRRTADLRAAGLSPVLAAGSGASSGPVVSTQAPQIGQIGITDKMSQVAQLTLQAIRQDADISRTYAETKFLGQQLNKSKADERLVDMQTIKEAWNLKQAKDVGTRTNTGGLTGQVSDILNIIKNNMHLRSETSEERAIRIREEKKKK